MKYLLTLSIVFFSFFSFSQSLNIANVQTDYLEAVKLSRNQDKGILYVFTKNSNNETLRDFEANFLKSPEFQKLTSKFVVLQVNCSDSVDPESNTAMYCKRLTPIYNPMEIFPAIMVTDKSQKPLGDLMTDFSKEKTNANLQKLNSY